MRESEFGLLALMNVKSSPCSSDRSAPLEVLLMADSIVFEGLDNIERIILADPGYLSYVTLIDRSLQRGQKETQLARIDFTPEQLASLIAQMQQLEELSLDPDDSDDSDDSDDEDADDSADHPDDQNPFNVPLARASERAPSSVTAPHHSGSPQPPVPDRKTMLEALCFWIRSNVAMNMVGEARRGFRVRLYSAKGSKILATGSFVAFNPKVSESPVRRAQEPGVSGYSLPPDPSIALQTDTALEGAAVAFQNLGQSYVAFNELVLDGVKGMQGIMTRTNQDLSEQLTAARQHEASLMDFIMQQRRVERDISTQGMELQAQEQRTALAREAIDQLGNTMQVMMLARGGHPMLQALSQALQSSPRLAQALERPEVQGLLREPRALDSLAQMLESAAGQLSGAGQPAVSRPMPPPGMFPPYMTGNQQLGWGAPALSPGYQTGYPPQSGSYAPPPPAPTPWGQPGVSYGVPPQAGQQPFQGGSQSPSPWGPGNTVGVHIGQLPQYQPVAAAVQASAGPRAAATQTPGTVSDTGRPVSGGGAAPSGPPTPVPPAGSAAPSA